MKISIVVPVYNNQGNLLPLYEDLQEKFFSKIDYEYELVMVNDGSKDESYKIMCELASRDKHIKIYSLSRNFGAYAAVLCGISKATGDCIMVKAADLQEPTEMIFDMVKSWQKGNNVVLAVREARDDDAISTFFANRYYSLVRKTAFPNMPIGGFDVYLIDKKVAKVLELLDEKNSSDTSLILWSGFKTDIVYYHRVARKIGKSQWTFRKKFRLVTDTLFSFSTVPVATVWVIGLFCSFGALIWALYVFIEKLRGAIPVEGWTTIVIFQLFSFGVIMLTLGILGEYLWRIFDSSRKRPPYIIEDDNEEDR